MIIDNKKSLTYTLDDNTEIGYCKYKIKRDNSVFVEYIFVEHKYRKQGVGEEILLYLYKKYGPVYGEFVTAGGVKLLNKFLKDYVYKQ